MYLMQSLAVSRPYLTGTVLIKIFSELPYFSQIIKLITAFAVSGLPGDESEPGYALRKRLTA
jgi:hypothetical protein